MSKKSFIDAVRVETPCTEKWDEMTGTNKVRLCSHCATNVNDLSAMTRKEAMRTARDSGGNLCVRYIQDPNTRRPLFAGQLLQITRRAPGLAAGVMSASMALSTQAYAQSAPPNTEPVTPITVEQKLDTKGTEVTSGGSISTVLTNKQIEELPINDRQFITMGVMVSTRSIEYKNPITTAVQAGDIEVVRDLIARGKDVNGKEEDGTSPLAAAVETGNVEIVQMLLNFGSKVNARDKERQTPVMRLDEDATPELVRTLIRAGAKLNVVDNDGDTPLILAARQVSPEVLRVLIDAGASVNVSNKLGETPLMMAADADDIEKVRMLILAGADVNAKDKEGDTAWDKTSESDIEDLLVSHGAVIEESDEGEEVVTITPAILY